MKKLSVLSFLLALIAAGVSAVALYMASPKGLQNTLVKNPDVLLEAGKAVEKAMQEEALAKQQEAMKKAEETIMENIELFNNDKNAPFTGPEREFPPVWTKPPLTLPRLILYS